MKRGLVSFLKHLSCLHLPFHPPCLLCFLPGAAAVHEMALRRSRVPGLQPHSAELRRGQIPF